MQSLKLNVNTKLSLFDTYVGSVANYRCEVWGSLPAKDIEKVHLNFCKNNTWCVEKYCFNDGIYYNRKYRMLKYCLKFKKVIIVF